MAFSSIGNQQLGKFLQIYFSNGVRTQISTDFKEYEFVQSIREMNPNGREVRFFFQNSFGPSGVQNRNPNFSAAFPTAQRIGVKEHTALYKEVSATIELEYNLYKMAQMSPAKYAEPLALEMESKMTASKRLLAAQFWGDGTGVLGTATATATLIGSDVLFTLNSTNSARGHAGFFEFDEIIKLKDADGSADSTILINTNVLPEYWKVVDKDHAAGTVRLRPLDSSFAEITATSVDAAPTAGEVFYKYQQPNFVDFTSSIADYGSISEAMPGLESLTANDGRIVHGIEMLGATAGSVYDAGNNPFTTSHIQAAHSNTKRRVGSTRYKYSKMFMAPEVHNALIDSREDDRRFQTYQDNKRGIVRFGYVHENDMLEAATSEFCPQTRVYILPEANSGEKVLCTYLSDFESVRAKDGDEFMLKPSASGGHENRITSYMNAIGTTVCKHPAAITRIENFTV